jgi:hypothetical protein
MFKIINHFLSGSYLISLDRERIVREVSEQFVSIENVYTNSDIARIGDLVKGAINRQINEHNPGNSG